MQACIGRGSTSLVYSAFDKQIKRQVAIKVLPRHVLAADQMQRFRQEAEIHARLIHPNIVKLYNTHEDRGFFALIMELLQGCTLEELLQTKAPLAAGEIIHLSRSILSALAKAHSKGIVHQDLKASNIFLCNDGSVKIKDFGLAAFTESGGAGLTPSHASTNGNLQLRCAYMSPEQILGKDCTSRSDLYAFGILLYRMSTGHLPFSSSSDFAMMEKQVREKPVAPDQLHADVSKEMNHVIMALLEKDPELRPPDCRQLWEMLRGIAKTMPIKLEDRSLSDLHCNPDPLISSAAPDAYEASISLEKTMPDDEQALDRRGHSSVVTLLRILQRADRETIPTKHSASASRLNPASIASLKKAIADLPPLPDIWHLVQRVLESDDASPADLSAVIRTDPVLSAHVLSLANSAAYAIHDRELNNISMAVARIGMNDLHTFLIQKLTPDFSQLSQRSGKRSIPIRDEMRIIWLHSQIIGKLAASLAAFSPTVAASTVRMYGMMHDIGKLVILHIESDKNLELLKLNLLEGMPALEAEQQCFGYTHIDAGMMLALHWKLPRPLQQFIFHHHATESANPDSLPDDIRQALLLVHTAHLIARAVQHANGTIESIWSPSERSHPRGMAKLLANQCQLPLEDESLYQGLCEEYAWVEDCFFHSVSG